MMHHVRQVMTLLLALAVLMGARAVVRAQDGSLLATHTVQAGETLFSIASQYNTTAETLAQANGILNPAQILPGQVLTIPLLPAAQLSSGTPVPGAPPVQPGPFSVCRATASWPPPWDTHFNLSRSSSTNCSIRA